MDALLIEEEVRKFFRDARYKQLQWTSQVRSNCSLSASTLVYEVLISIQRSKFQDLQLRDDLELMLNASLDLPKLSRVDVYLRPIKHWHGQGTSYKRGTDESDEVWLDTISPGLGASKDVEVFFPSTYRKPSSGS